MWPIVNIHFKMKLDSSLALRKLFNIRLPDSHARLLSTRPISLALLHPSLQISLAQHKYFRVVTPSLTGLVGRAGRTSSRAKKANVGGPLSSPSGDGLYTQERPSTACSLPSQNQVGGANLNISAVKPRDSELRHYWPSLASHGSTLSRPAGLGFASVTAGGKKKGRRNLCVSSRS